MSSLLGNIFGVADKTKAGVKSPAAPNPAGEDTRARRGCREGRGGSGLCPCGCAVPWACAALGAHPAHPTLPDLGAPSQGFTPAPMSKGSLAHRAPRGSGDEIHPCAKNHKPR